MFRRRWSALPADPVYPSDMKQLGYFVNDIDEIRSINDPNKYFKYFITKNTRWNDRQRFAMNESIESLVHSRLEALGLEKTILRAGTPADSPHVPIFVSANIRTAARVVVLFGESAQDLGIVAHRVIGGPGGVAKGSVLSVVQAIQAADPWGRVGVVIANPGQLWWWPEGKKGLTLSGRFGVAMQSAVHYGRAYDARLNAVPGHETVGRHVKSVFEEVLGRVARRDARLAVVAVTDVADEVERYLDDDETWKVWGPRMESLSLLGNFYGTTEDIKCDAFKTFLTERARNWIGDLKPLDAPLAKSEGSAARPGMGCPVLSAGPEAYLAELLLVHAHPSVLKFIREVATTEDFRNPRFHVDEAPPEPDSTRYWSGFTDKEDGKVSGEAKVPGDQKGGAAEDKAGADKAPETSTMPEQKAAQPRADESALVKEGWTRVVEEEEEPLREFLCEESLRQLGVPGHTAAPDVPAKKADTATSKPDGDEPGAVKEPDNHPPGEQNTDKPGRNELNPDEGQITPDKTDTGAFTADSKPRTTAIKELDSIRERLDRLGKKMDEEGKQAAARQKEKEELEFMRREVLHTLEQVEKLAAQTLEEDGRVGSSSSDDEDDDDEDEDDDDE